MGNVDETGVAAAVVLVVGATAGAAGVGSGGVGSVGSTMGVSAGGVAT